MLHAHAADPKFLGAFKSDRLPAWLWHFHVTKPCKSGSLILFEAFTPSGSELIKGHYELIELDSVVTSSDEAFDGTLQLRNRARVASQQQIHKMCVNLRPALLTDSRTTDLGSPLLDNINQVLSGNGRTSALRHIYRSDPKKASEYKRYLYDHAHEFGLDPEQVKKLKQPMLVRRVIDYGGLSEIEFARVSNTHQILGMGEAEIAMADARMLNQHPKLMNQFHPGDDGEIITSKNMNFLHEFAEVTKSLAELQSHNGWNKTITSQRVRNAVFVMLAWISTRKSSTKS